MPFEEIAKEIARYVMENYVSRWGKDLVRYYRAEVITPAANGKVTVKRPFDGINLTLPCTTAAENLAAGAQCIVLVLGNESNAIVFSDGMMQAIGSGGGGGGGDAHFEGETLVISSGSAHFDGETLVI